MGVTNRKFQDNDKIPFGSTLKPAHFKGKVEQALLKRSLPKFSLLDESFADDKAFQLPQA